MGFYGVRGDFEVFILFLPRQVFVLLFYLFCFVVRQSRTTTGVCWTIRDPDTIFYTIAGLFWPRSELFWDVNIGANSATDLLTFLFELSLALPNNNNEIAIILFANSTMYFY